jgi:hypothetical protein
MRELGSRLTPDAGVSIVFKHPIALSLALKKFGGADRDRTEDLLNAIIPNLSRASYSWKKYPALLTSEVQQFFRLYQVLSQKIRTRFGQSSSLQQSSNDQTLSREPQCAHESVALRRQSMSPLAKRPTISFTRLATTPLCGE